MKKILYGMMAGLIIIGLLTVFSACGPEPGNDSQSPSININNYHVADQGTLDDGDSETEDNSNNEDNDQTSTSYDNDTSVGGNYSPSP